ncbi:hypothetical protein ZWY2020_043566 [Hordeum vulgare]|nr:hypothetical protein ZWY2020_043566 [Hordeum vulgare]
MELAISAVTGELVSRFVSFLADKYRSSRCAQPEERLVKRLQQLLLRARTVVEEADGRYITNSGMLAQLDVLAGAMYRGYWVLAAFSYMSLEETETTPLEEDAEVSRFSPTKRLRRVHGSARKNKAVYLADLQGMLESLEDVVASMTEFVVLLGGCDRMLRRPYSVPLRQHHVGRHTEKQKLLNFVLQHSPPGCTPAVLPVIGAPAVGKRTLVAHICKDERVRSHFTSILHLNGDSICRLADHDRSLLSGNTLVVVEVVSDVSEEDWAKFHSTLASMDSGSKVIIINRLKVRATGNHEADLPQHPSYEEFSYLFKTLPHSGRTGMLSRMRRSVERNLSMFGEHPRLLIERRHQWQQPHGSYDGRASLPRVRLGDLMMDPGFGHRGFQCGFVGIKVATVLLIHSFRSKWKWRSRFEETEYSPDWEEASLWKAF